VKATEDQLELQRQCAAASTNAFDHVKRARSAIFATATAMSALLDTMQDPAERKLCIEVRQRWANAYQTLTQVLTTLEEL
jgi:hypothetical protein